MINAWSRYQLPCAVSHVLLFQLNAHNMLNTFIETSQQDALSVCIYSTIFVQLYMFRTTISFIIRSL